MSDVLGWGQDATREDEAALTREQFEVRYVANSNLTIAHFRAWGRYVEPCDCGDEICDGWQMGHQYDDARVEDAMRSAKDSCRG
jgi:hypothetical protein